MILVTGCAGFIGYWTSKRLLNLNMEVIGLDNMNDYYDVKIKKDRLNNLKKYTSFKFVQCNLEDNLQAIFSDHTLDLVINLAAQAGVRYSLENPQSYISSNIVGFTNILELCRFKQIPCLYASSSSVYGGNTKYPFSETDNVDMPVSLYAATKKSNELMAYTYSHLYHIPTIGLRFFTVYGPFGRPDMALFKFTKNIIEDKPIDVYNYGKMIRDFTYVDDIVDSIERITKHMLKLTMDSSHKVYNIGSDNPVQLLEFIRIIEDILGKEAIKNMMPMQMGDVPQTYADVSKLKKDFDYKPSTPLKDGIAKFINWYREYYQV